MAKPTLVADPAENNDVQPSSAAKKKLPRIGNPEAQSNWEWVDSIKDADWKNLTCYLYRTAPAIDRQASGKEITLERFGSKFTVQDIFSRHGSGRYKFIFSYAPPDGGQWIRVRQFYESLMDLTKPPRVGLGDWLDNPANKDWEWARPMLRAEEVEREKTAAEKIAGGQPQANPIEQLSDSIDLVQKLMPKDNNNLLLVELMKQQDPSKLLTLAKEIASLNPPAAPQTGESAALTMMMQFLMQELKAARSVAPADPIQTAATLITGVKGMMDTLGGGAAAAAGKPDTTAVVVETLGGIFGKVVEGLGEHVPQILGTIQFLKERDLQIAQVAAQRDMNPVKPWEANGGGAPAPATMAARPIPQPQPIPQPAAPPPAPIPQQPMTPASFAMKHQHLLNRQMHFLIDKYRTETGYDAQDHLIAKEGELAFAQIREDATVDILMELTKLNPDLLEIFKDRDKARTFFTELLSDPNEADDDEDPKPEASANV